MFKSEPVATMRVTMYCDECGDICDYTGGAFKCDPPKYQHSCRGCNKEYVLPEVFPTIEYI